MTEGGVEEGGGDGEAGEVGGEDRDGEQVVGE